MKALLCLFVVAVAALALGRPAASSAGGACTPDPTWGTLNRQFEAEVAKLVNEHRVAIGLQPLAISPALRRSAEWKALHMAGYEYLAHDDPAPPVARDAFQRMRDCGYTYAAALAENIAVGQPTPADVVQAWLSSEGHRRNIENPEYVVIGIGAASRGGGPFYWVQNFGSYDDSGSNLLFEGWNRISWVGASAAGIPAIRAALDDLTGGAWEAVAKYNNGWRTAYKSPPLPSMNTLQRLNPGDEVWLYVREDVALP